MKQKNILYKFLYFLLIITFAFSFIACSNNKNINEKNGIENTVTKTITETKETTSKSLDENELNNKINSIPPKNTSQQRLDLLIQIDDFVRNSVSGNSFSPKIFSFIKIRLDQALKEIPQTKVPKGNVKIWYIYNMGIIAKSEDKTIAIDLGADYVYPSISAFTKYIDILLITHFHSDHIGLSVLKEAINSGVAVIVPDDKVVLKKNMFVRDPNGEDAVSLLKRLNNANWNNLIYLNPQEKTMIKDIEITAYPSIHVNNPDEEGSYFDIPINWYYVNLHGFTILHMGDGTSFNYEPDFINKDIDVFITHSTNLDDRTRDTLDKFITTNIKTILPMHILELGHGPDILNKNSDCFMTYQSILDNYSNGYYKGFEGKIKFIPIIWGESISNT